MGGSGVTDEKWGSRKKVGGRTITCLIDDNKRDDLTLGDNSIDDFKIGDNLDFTMFMSCICKIICKIMIVFQQTWMNGTLGKHFISMGTSFLVYIINNVLQTF